MVKYILLCCISLTKNALEHELDELEQLFLMHQVDSHWIMLRLCPSHGRSVSLGVNGGVGWPGRWASA